MASLFCVYRKTHRVGVTVYVDGGFTLTHRYITVCSYISTMVFVELWARAAVILFLPQT